MSGGVARAKRPAYWQQASHELAAADPLLAEMVGRYAGTSLVTRGDPFVTLARSIVGQQISVKAADAVWGRVVARLPALTPAAVLATSVDDLRACGLSARKAEYFGDLAGRFADGRIRPRRWSRLSDAALIEELSATRGIGVWTVEMLLIFNLMRPDVFPLDDKGLQRAVSLHYFNGEALARRQLLEFGERWRPWRSVATWYLWRSLDPLPVEY